MKTKLLFAIFIVCSNCYSQNWLWAKSAVGSYNDEGWSVSADLSGNVFVTGWFYSSTITFGTTTLTNSGGANVFIAKYDAAGNSIWAKSATGASYDYGLSVNADAAGNVFVTGMFLSTTITFGSITLTNSGSRDMFIVKYDANGNVLWAKKVGGAGYDEGWSVSSDASGNVFVTGEFDSPTISFGSTTLTNTGGADMFIAKYDAAGNVLWARNTNGTSGDQGSSVSADAGGNVFVTGCFGSSTLTFGSTTLINAGGGSYDVFIAKYDANGNALWAKSAGGNYYDMGLSVSSDAAGNAFITGEFYSDTITFGATTLTKAGDIDMFIVKYSAYGNVLWAKSAGGTSDDEGFSVSADATGNVFVTGRFFSPTIAFGSTTLTDPNHGNDIPMFIVKYDAKGNVLCATALPSGGYQNGVSVDPLGNAYIGGSFWNNPFIVGSDTLTLTGGSTVFVAKYVCCSGTTATITGASFDTICSGKTTKLNVTGGYLGTSASASWKWYTGSCDGVFIGNGTSVNVSPTSSTTYFVKAEGYCNITSCDSINIKVNVTPTASYTAEYIANCSGVTGYFKNESMNADNYIWNFSDGSVSNQFNANHIFTFKSASSVSLIAFNNNGCKDTLTLNNNFNSFQDICSISIPNIFTPNNDGINDEFILNSSFDISECASITIFDRWGKVMYSSTNSTIKWDGRTTSELKASSGVYFYILNINDIKYKGSITLLD